MPRNSPLIAPKLCKSGKNVYVNLPGKKKKYFGRYTDPQSHKKYEQWVREWKKENFPAPESPNGGAPAGSTPLNPTPDSQSNSVGASPVPVERRACRNIADLCVQFLEYARTAKKRDNVVHFEQTVRWMARAGVLLESVESFTVSRLETVRDTMRDGGRLCRKTINGYMDRMINMFQWGDTRQILPDSFRSTLERMKQLEKVATGTPGYFDHEEKKDVPLADVKLTLPALSPTVQAMVKVQWLGGFRPNEVFKMRVGDIDRTPQENGLWWYTPGSYKTQHGEKKKRGVGIRFPLGKPEQRYLEPYLKGKEPNQSVFSPRTAIMERGRVPSSRVGEFYNKDSFGLAIERAILRINKTLPDGEKMEKWQPHQLRHSGGTETALRKALEYGKMYTTALLGHRTVAMANTYVHADLPIRVQLALERVDPFIEREEN